MLAGWDFFCCDFLKILLKTHSHQFPKAMKEFYWNNDDIHVFICGSQVSERQCHYELRIDVLFLLKVVTNIIFIL